MVYTCKESRYLSPSSLAVSAKRPVFDSGRVYLECLVHKLASFPDSPPEHECGGEPGNEVTVHLFHNTEIAYSMQLFHSLVPNLFILK